MSVGTGPVWASIAGAVSLCHSLFGCEFLKNTSEFSLLQASSFFKGQEAGRGGGSSAGTEIPFTCWPICDTILWQKE